MNSYNYWLVSLLVFAALSPKSSLLAETAKPPLAPKTVKIGGDSSTSRDHFVKVKAGRFVVDGQQYAFIGTNFWYGPNLGADDRTGDRPRLLRELDRLAELGIRNLRIMAASEGPDTEMWRMVPAMQPEQGIYNQAVMHGLDFLLDEMKKRHMHAVMCLSNYWHWSGGMAQYLSWNNAGPIPYPPPAEHGDWNRYKRYTEQFYTNLKAKAALANHIHYIVTRTNSITGIKYIDDPTIMTWELANEPAEPQIQKEIPAYIAWVKESAHQIKQLDLNHLVISGSEGPTFQQVHRLQDIDYATIHIWVQNVGWYDPGHPDQTYRTSLVRAQTDLEDHRKIMLTIGKPLVLAEFGLARDAGRFDTSSPTSYRDDFYTKLMQQVYSAAQHKKGISGLNFWAWAGEGRSHVAGHVWQHGEAFIGDPPHEQQGWYSVYDEDGSTLKIVSSFAQKMDALR